MVIREIEKILRRKKDYNVIMVHVQRPKSTNVKIKEAIFFFLFKLFLLILECTQAKDALVNNVKFSICDSVAFLMTSLGNVITSRGMRTCGVQEK